MNFREELKSKTAAVEKIVESYLPEESGTQHEIMEAMNYSFLAGGKRLRPMLMQETYRLFDGSSDIIEPFMAAIEMIHTYSLIHDDLPAMDNDEYRRGKKTTHAVYGEAMGILAGDALLNFAFETACKGLMQDVGNPAVARAVQILAQKDSNPTVVSLLLSLESVFATVAGVILLHDQMSGREYVGCVFMLAAVVLAQLPDRKRVFYKS